MCFHIKAAVLIGYTLLSLAANSAPSYFANDLGTLYEGATSVITALNENGVGAGWNYVPQTGGLTGLMFKDNAIIDLGGLNGGRGQGLTQALGINNADTIVGVSRLSDEYTSHAFIYKNGEMTDLTPGLAGFAFASSINDSGVIVGAINSTAVKWDEAATTSLGFYQAYRINNLNWITGFNYGQAPVYVDGLLSFIGPRGSSLIGSGINDLGDIVGYGDFGWLFSGGQFTRLSMEAFDINNTKQIIGRANGVGILFDKGV
jgi:probable HAF family extracellular repeat protein